LAWFALKILSVPLCHQRINPCETQNTGLRLNRHRGFLFFGSVLIDREWDFLFFGSVLIDREWGFLFFVLVKLFLSMVKLYVNMPGLSVRTFYYSSGVI
jgi:hypothetical protein